jgi:outer membrane protein with beta-barrel domain
MRQAMRCGVWAVMLAWAGAARAQEVPQHKGGFARVMLGGGYASLDENSGGHDTRIHGGGAAFSVDGGYFVVPNLALGLDLSVYALPKPTVTQDSMDLGSSSATVDLINIGLGATYFVPGDVYLGLNVGAAVASIEYSNQSVNSETGFGMGLLLGKEWSISPHWGLGLAGQFFFMSIPDHASNGLPTNFSVAGGGILVSGSYGGGG